MDPAGPMHGSPATPGAARTGRRRAGAREPLAPGAESGWAWLAALGTSPIRLTTENVAISMSVRWLGGMIVRGRFTGVQGMIHLPTSEDDTMAVTVEVRPDSVRTGISLRDRHLRGPLFLDAAHHPVITFRGGDALRLPTHIAVPGSLTIRGITRTEELRCSIEEVGARRELVADVTLNRRVYNVGVPRGLRRLDPLFMVIGDEVRIAIRVAL